MEDNIKYPTEMSSTQSNGNLNTTECMHCGQTTLINHKSLLNMLKLPTCAFFAQVQSQVEPSAEEYFYSQKFRLSDYHEEQYAIELMESYKNLCVEQKTKELEKEKLEILKTAVNAIHLNDSADYYRGLYSIVHKIVPEYLGKKDLKDLYEDLNP